MAVSCLPAFLHRLDSQSSEGQRQRHITHPPPGLDELPVCLQSPEQQRRQTGNVRCSCAACVCVCVFMCACQHFSAFSVFPKSFTLCGRVYGSSDVWLCRGGQLRGRRDLFKSAKRNRAREAVCVYVCVFGASCWPGYEWVSEGELFGAELSWAQQEKSTREATMGLGQSSKAPVTEDTDEGEY